MVHRLNDTKNDQRRSGCQEGHSEFQLWLLTVKIGKDRTQKEAGIVVSFQVSVCSEEHSLSCVSTTGVMAMAVLADVPFFKGLVGHPKNHTSRQIAVFGIANLVTIDVNHSL